MRIIVWAAGPGACTVQGHGHQKSLYGNASAVKTQRSAKGRGARADGDMWLGNWGGRAANDCRPGNVMNGRWVRCCGGRRPAPGRPYTPPGRGETKCRSRGTACAAAAAATTLCPGPLSSCAPASGLPIVHSVLGKCTRWHVRAGLCRRHAGLVWALPAGLVAGCVAVAGREVVAGAPLLILLAAGG